MTLDIPDDLLIHFCGGSWGNATATDIGAIVKKYLDGSSVNRASRRTLMGQFLLEHLEHQLRRS